MRTKRQIEASRRNGRRSRGPGLQGRERSKQNATRHGLSGTGMVLPEDMAEAVNARYADWYHALKPHHDIDEAFVRWVATDSIMFEGAQKYLVVQINLQVKAAREDWDEDRYWKALDLAAGLEADPSRAAEQLRGFRQGAELLIERWEALEAILADRGGWSEGQRRLALDLLGVPAELREGRTPLDPEEGETEAEACRAAVAAELEALRGRVAGRLGEKDEDERSAAELGYPGADSHGVKLAKRYLGTIARRLSWALGKLHQIKARYIDPNDRSSFRLSREFELMYREIEAKLKAAKPRLLGEPFSPREVADLHAIHDAETAPTPVPPHADLTEIRAVPDPAPAAPAAAPSGEPIVVPPYGAIPPGPACSAPTVEEAAVGTEAKTKKE